MSIKKNIVYVGGLDDCVTEEILHAAFIPFGEIKNVQLGKDYVSNKSRGFGFVEYYHDEDAYDAIDNMDSSELFGRTIHCKYAKPNSKGQAGKAVWATEEYLQSSMEDNSSN